jgi:hypothetical protein
VHHYLADTIRSGLDCRNTYGTANGFDFANGHSDATAALLAIDREGRAARENE